LRFRAFGARRFRDWRAESNQSIVRLGLPVRSAETLRGDRVPANGFGGVARAFFYAGQLERRHRVARALKKLGELRRGFAAGLGLADAGLYLSPVAHDQTF